MLNSYLKRRPGGYIWQLRVPVPKDVQAAYGRKEFTKSLGEADRAKAEAKALPIITELHAEWEGLRAQSGCTRDGEVKPDFQSELLTIAESIFEQTRSVAVQRMKHLSERDELRAGDELAKLERMRAAVARDFVYGDLDRWAPVAERVLANRGIQLDRTSEEFRRLAAVLSEVGLAAFDVTVRQFQGELNAQPSSEVLTRARKAREAAEAGAADVAFSDLVDSYMRQWRAEKGSIKETNTDQQKLATFRLFGQYWQEKPIRGVKEKDAAEFRDTIKLLNPNWARSPKARELHWNDLIAQFGNQPLGLSASTMNRHMRTLQSLWNWAEKRGHCNGKNPFAGFHKRIRLGENSHSYRPWEVDELQRLFDPRPKRNDLCELMIVGMYTGMRLDEIASLTWGRVRTQDEGEETITFFDVDDAKTLAGIRKVPVHSALGWLLQRERGADDDRLWPQFNLEGVGRKAGADASKMFSDYKIARGIKDRQKTFHSFRKNVTRIMERAGVPENEWAQVFGHERGFTYSVYNPDGITLARKAEIIELIDYPGVAVPHPNSGAS